MKTGSRKFARVTINSTTYEVTVPQWRALELLSPTWKFFKWRVFHFNTRLGLERQEWAEFRNIEGYLQARLLPAGREIRDEIYRRLAIRQARAQGEHL